MRNPTSDSRPPGFGWSPYYHDGKNTVDEICKIFGIGRTSFYNYLRKEKKAIQAG